MGNFSVSREAFRKNLRELVSEGIDTHGLLVVFKKELADHFSSYRFTILFALIAMVSLISAYMTGISLREELEGIAKPKFVFLMLFTSRGGWFSLDWFVAFLFPLIGIVLGFDSINREKSTGTMSKLVSQPIFRDSIINGKFLAGITTIAIMLVSIVLVISGLGLRVLGVVPGAEEVWRIIVYLVISIVYISFWLGISMLSSIVFRSIATSALASIAIWVFFFFFTIIGPATMANAFAPVNQPGTDADTIIRHTRIQEGVKLSSPMGLYSDATATVIDPMRKTTKSVLMGRVERLLSERFQNPLPLSQSILVVWPYIVSLIAITLICFGCCYAVFMRQEIRSV